MKYIEQVIVGFTFGTGFILCVLFFKMVLKVNLS